MNNITTSFNMPMYVNKPSVAFYGYNTLAKELPKLTNSPVNKGISNIIRSLNSKQVKSLIEMHCNKIESVNSNEIMNQRFVELGYEIPPNNCSLDLNIHSSKLQSAWKNIDAISDLSYGTVSWKNTLVYGSSIGGVVTTSIQVFSVSTLIAGTIVGSSLCALAKLGYDTVRSIMSSKPYLSQVKNKQLIAERVIFEDILAKNAQHYHLKVTTNLTHSLIKMDNFPIIFDNLFKFLEVPSSKVPALFRAILVGIVDTWIEITAKQDTTNASLVFDKKTTNKKIVENTLLALTLDNEFISHGIEITPKNRPYKPSIDVKNHLINNLNILPAGFYTIDVDIFCALNIKDSTYGKTYRLFIPTHNLIYTTSSLEDISNKILGSLEAQDKYINLMKIAGEL